MTSLLLAFLLLGPEPASRLAEAITGVDKGALVDVCRRESRCSWIGVHDRDAHLSRRSWLGHVRLGQLDPQCQPYRPRWWATVGTHGLNAAAHHPYLPRCYPPQVLAIPIVSAFVSAAKWHRRCRDRVTLRWCPRRGS